MRASELRQMTRDEVSRRLAELRDEQFKLTIRKASEELPNPLRLRMLRRDVARCMTIIGEMDRSAEAKPAEHARG